MNDVVIRPLRFTADLKAMRTFLETIGLRPRIEGEAGGWVDLVAGAGLVALHDAATSATGGRPGETSLSFEARDIDELKERLVAAGYDDATVFDEAYGRVLKVTAPDHVEIWIDERSDDLYGYRLHHAEPDPRLTVVPYLTGASASDWQRFLETLGCDEPAQYGPADGGFAVRLDFGTTEPLAEVAARLTEYAAEVGGDELAVTDPDGQPVRLHRATS